MNTMFQAIRVAKLQDHPYRLVHSATEFHLQLPYDAKKSHSLSEKIFHPAEFFHQ
jgi:hypothetical protein